MDAYGKISTPGTNHKQSLCDIRIRTAKLVTQVIPAKPHTSMYSNFEWNSHVLINGLAKL